MWCLETKVTELICENYLNLTEWEIEMIKLEDSISFSVLSLKFTRYMNYWVKKKNATHLFILSSKHESILS